MNQTLLFILILFFVTTSMDAQQAYQSINSDKNNELSLCFLPLFTTMNTSVSENIKMMGVPRMSYGLSVIYSSVFNRFVSLQTGVIYHSMSYEIVIERSNGYMIYLENIHIPLLFALSTNKNLPINYTIFAGPQLGLNISSSIKYPSYTNSYRDTTQVILSVNPLDFGVAYGIGADIKLTASEALRLDIGLRGSTGLLDKSGPESQSNQLNIIASQTTINTFGGYVGFKFAF